MNIVLFHCTVTSWRSSQVDLGRVYSIYGLQTKGDEINNKWTINYTISCSLDDTTYLYLSDSPSHASGSYDARAFLGNNDTSSLVTQQVTNIAYCRYVRLHPLHFQSGIAIRWEILVGQCTSCFNSKS